MYIRPTVEQNDEMLDAFTLQITHQLDGEFDPSPSPPSNSNNASVLPLVFFY